MIRVKAFRVRNWRDAVEVLALGTGIGIVGLIVIVLVVILILRML